MTGRYLRSMLNRYGETVEVYGSLGRVKARAFIQPLRRRHRLYINDKVIHAGYFDNSCKLYIGSPNDGYTLKEGTIIRSKAQDYVVMTSEDYVVGDETVYIWAILRLKNDLEEDDYDVSDR